VNPSPAVRSRGPRSAAEPIPSAAFGIVEAPLSWGERVANVGAARKLVILLVLAAIWEAYARWLNNPLLFPTFGATVEAFAQGVASGELPARRSPRSRSCSSATEPASRARRC